MMSKAARLDIRTMRSTMRPFIVGIGGAMRAGSSSEQALRVALSAAEHLGAATRLFAGADLNFPVYEPDNPARSNAALAFLDALRRADGIMIGTPSYHGSLSGFVKNALDYAEDLRNDRQPYFEGRAVGCIVCADGPQSLGPTIAALRAIVHALRGWPTPFAAAISSRSNRPEAEGHGASLEVRRTLQLVAEQVVEFARMRFAYEVESAQVRRFQPPETALRG
jgi:FMN reductase